MTNPESLPTTYAAENVEGHWYAQWEKAGLFAAHAEKVTKGKAESYVVMMPPPNVTGVLHNGHALFVTLQDILIRYNRMLGKEALWLPGTDHAGIATQAVVERELKKKGIERKKIGRQKFLEHVWAYKEKNGDRIVKQMKMLGASADWSKLRFTMDEQCTAAVKHAFVQLWNEGLIYRGERLINWDPGSHTAISDEEVEHEERQTDLWEFAYKLEGDPAQEIVVATTRPETMLGDTAIAVHPADDRYKNMVGKKVVHPFISNRVIPIIADDYVDLEFGTGAVKITPAHDPNDFEMGKRHELEFINIFTKDGAVNMHGGKFSGLTIQAARKAVKKMLTELGLHRGGKQITNAVSISQRSGATIEPMISRQYFLKTDGMAKSAMQSVENGDTRIIPEAWKKTWDNFLSNNRDWCISRQLWWGHRIPVYYDIHKMREIIEANPDADAHEAMHAGKSNAEILKIAMDEFPEEIVHQFSVASSDDLTASAEGSNYIQEADVLDTWFSSGLWPFSTLGWPNKTPELAAFYPGAVLETGFDILFFWVARMMMFGTHFMGEVPFKDIYLHSMVRDSHGKKMSKSLGNAIDPIDVVEGISLENLQAKTKTYPVPEKLLPKVLEGIEKEYPKGIPASGADGLRLSLAMLSGQGRDVRLAIDRVAGYRTFLNKVWNATRFALLRIEKFHTVLPDKNDLDLSSRWILSRLNSTVSQTRKHLDGYRFDLAAEGVYHFFWTEFCDWYIELTKESFEGDDPAKKKDVSTVLLHVLDVSMRLLHPFCPFISEEIWQNIPGTKERWKQQGFEYCASAPYPSPDSAVQDMAAEKDMGVIQEAVVAIRNLRQESGLSASKRLSAVIVTSDDNLDFVASTAEIIRIAKLSSLLIEKANNFKNPAQAATKACQGFEVVLSLEGLLDAAKETARLEKEIEKITKEINGLSVRLQSESFVARAPKAVVEKAQNQLAKLEEKLARTKEALATFAG